MAGALPRPLPPPPSWRRQATAADMCAGCSGRRIVRSIVTWATLGLGAAALSACGDYGNGGYGGYGGPYGASLMSFVGTNDAVLAWGDPYVGNYVAAPTGSYAGKRDSQVGTIDPLNGAALGQPAGVEIYKYKDGHIYALDLTSYGFPESRQISTEAAATLDDACSFTGTAAAIGANSDYQGVYFAIDYQAPTNDTYFYRLPGADGVCNTADDVVHQVRTGMAASAAPLVAPAMPITAVHSAQGAISGFVARSGSSLLLYDNNFANPITLGTFAAPIAVATALPVGLETGFPAGQLFLVDGNLVFVDYVAHTVSAPLLTIPNGTPTGSAALFAASPGALYVAINTPAAGSTPASAAIYAIPADGSAAPSALLTTPGSVTDMQFPVQSTNLIFSTLSPNFGVFALPQAGGTALTLLASAQNGGNFTATATAVFYTSWNDALDSVNKVETRSATTAGVVGVNGAVITAPLGNARFALGGEAVAWPTDGTLTVRTAWQTLLQVQALTPVTVHDSATGWTITDDGVGGGLLLAIDAGSGRVNSMIGTMPASMATGLQADFRSAVHSGFITATSALSTQNPSSQDEYLLNTVFGYSLVRVTGNL